MSQTQNIVRRIFGDRKLPENLSNEAYDKYMQANFPAWMKEFEDGGFLEQTKLPAIKSEEELLEKLQEHRDDLLVLKFWKHGCIPCLTFAEMYKEAAERCKSYTGGNANSNSNSNKDSTSGVRRIVWYSVDSKALSTRQLVDYQLIAGTPTVQTFLGQRQVGSEIRATNIDDLLKEVYARVPVSL